jgi:hypothetical protein
MTVEGTKTVGANWREFEITPHGWTGRARRCTGICFDMTQLEGFGMTLFERGCQPDTEVIAIGFQMRSITDYGTHREAIGVQYTEDKPFGEMLTLATSRTTDEITDVLRSGDYLCHGIIGPEVVGQSGEAYRPLLGSIDTADHSATTSPAIRPRAAQAVGGRRIATGTENLSTRTRDAPAGNRHQRRRSTKGHDHHEPNRDLSRHR